MAQVKPKVVLLNYTNEPERTIATAAKLCYSDSSIGEIKDINDTRDVSKFIKMLKSLGHYSPFEHASFSFGLEGVSRSLLAQITRHRIASFSVRSQRYVSENSDTCFDYIVPPAIEALGPSAVSEFKQQMQTIQGWYNAWQSKLGSGEKANEDARFVLPNAAETKMIVTMNTRELYHFFNLRCCNRAQWEIREVAWRMLQLVSDVAPALFESSGPSCVAGACPEGKMSCGKVSEIRARRAVLSEEREGGLKRILENHPTLQPTAQEGELSS